MMDGEVEGHVFETERSNQPPKGKQSITRRIIAPLLSLMMPGVGQIYNSHWLKGGIFIIIVMLFSGWVRRQMLEEGANSMLALSFSPYVLVALVVFLGLGIWSVIDAYRDASLISKR